MSTEFTKAVTLTGVCAFNYEGVAVNSAVWSQWNDASRTKLGYVGVRAQASIRYAFVYSFLTPSWGGDITKLTLYVKLQEELGSNRTIRWSLTTTNPTGSTTLYTGQDLPSDSGRIDDGTIEVAASVDQWYAIEIDLNALVENATYYLVLSPYTTPSGTSNYATVNMQQSWSDVFQGEITYEADASDVSAPDGYFGSPLTISMTDDGLAKTLSYSCAGASGTIVSNTTAASYSWTPPTSLMARIPADSSAECTITCTTEAGTTTCTCTLYVPESVKPSLGSLSGSVVNSNTTVNQWGICLQNYSQIRTQFYAVSNSSTRLVSWSIDGGAFSLEGTINNSLTFTGDQLSSILTAAGTYTVKVTVTDQRGRSTTKTVGTYTVQAYTEPAATGVQMYRSDSSGNPYNDGTYLYAIATQVYSQVGSNSCSMQFQWKEKSASTWNTGSLTSGVGQVFGNGQIDILKTYTTRIAITDSLATSYVYSNVSTQAVAFNLKPSADSGAAFGGYANDDKILDLMNGWKLRVEDTDHILVTVNNVEVTLQDVLDDISGGGGGTTNYNNLTNKPSLNGTTLQGAVALATIGLVTALSSNSTDLQFPSAKCVWDMIGDVESALAALIGGS